MQSSVSGSDPVALGGHPNTGCLLPGQLHGATMRLRLARSQHAHEVQQLQEQMERLVPRGRVAELQQLLEGERQAARQLQEEERVSEDRGPRAA